MSTIDPEKPESAVHKGSTQFRIAFDGAPQKPVNVVAYVFDQKGDLLASVPVKDGLADRTPSPEALRHARVFFGPAVPEERDQKITLDAMARLKAYEPVWKYDPAQRVYEFQPIPEYYWKWWDWCRCRVRGQVVKVGAYPTLPEIKSILTGAVA